MQQVAASTAGRFPNTKISMSTLLLRGDVPFHIIQSNNAELSRGCALLGNVYLANHCDIHPQLNKQGVEVLARKLKKLPWNKAETKIRGTLLYIFSSMVMAASFYEYRTSSKVTTTSTFDDTAVEL